MEPLSLSRASLPPDHVLNGGTFVTNTSGTDTEEITASVAAFNDPSIYMKGSQLHTTRQPSNLSDFWAMHRERVAKAPTTNSTDPTK